MLEHHAHFLAVLVDVHLRVGDVHALEGDPASGGQLQQETYATVDGPAGPCPFVGYGGFSPLSEASTHSGDDGNITKASADLLKLVAMAVVKWIVLSDYTNSTHGRSFRGISWEYSGVDNV